jgi:molybdopterin-guanine dinucleotide biosynthesis protein A
VGADARLGGQASSSPAPLDCLLLAGGVPRPGEPLWAETSGRPKALLDVAGRPLAQWVLDALAAAAGIGRVLLVGPPELAQLHYAGELERVPAAGGLVDNLYAGIERLLELEPAAQRAAYCWSDIPLVTGPMLDHFLASAVEGVDVEAGLVERGDLEERFPEVDEKWLRFREGSFIAADFGVFRPRMAAALRPQLERLAPRRKSALRQAWQVGPGLLLTYLLGRLSWRGLEERLARVYAIRARIQRVADPELGLDVDGPVNLQICRRVLAGG